MEARNSYAVNRIRAMRWAATISEVAWYSGSEVL